MAGDPALAEVWQEPPAWEASPWVVLIPAMLALGFALWGLGSHPFSRDEGATVLAVSRTYPQLVRMLGIIDVVHGGYYSLMWVIMQTGGTSELAVRLPSAVAGIYPFGLRRLRDISQGESPGQSATLGGTYAATGVERQRLATVTRLWIASWKPGPVPISGNLRIRLLRAWHVGGVYLRPYLIGGQHYHHRGHWRPGDGTGAGDRVIH